MEFKSKNESLETVCKPVQVPTVSLFASHCGVQLGIETTVSSKWLKSAQSDASLTG